MTLNDFCEIYTAAGMAERSTRRALHLCEDIRMNLRTEDMGALKKECTPDLCAAIYWLEDAAFRLRRARDFMNTVEGGKNGEEWNA